MSRNYANFEIYFAKSWVCCSVTVVKLGFRQTRLNPAIREVFRKLKILGLSVKNVWNVELNRNQKEIAN